MKRVLELLGIIACLFAIYIFLQGVKSFFTTEKVYIKYGEDVFHSTPYCPYLGVDEMDIEYMQESGELYGSEKYSRSEAIKDLALDMCPYCFSAYEVKERNDYYINGYKERYKEKVMEAKRLREKKKLERLKKEHPNWF